MRREIVVLFLCCVSYSQANINWSNVKVNSVEVPVLDTAVRVPSSRITDGQRASVGDLPWLVAIIGDGAALCGGSLISDTWVLTAAHCVRNLSQFIVYMGSVDLMEDLKTVQITADKIAHPNFDSSSHQYDLALLRLPEVVDLNDNVNTILLPRAAEKDETFEGFKAMIGGWGATTEGGQPSLDALMYVIMPVITNEECSSVYGAKIVTEDILCTRGDGDKSTCKGDSGGPLAVGMSDGTHMQIGLVSFGAKDHCAGYPTGYTRLSSHTEWISQNTGIKT